MNGFHFHSDPDIHVHVYTREYTETHPVTDCETVYHGNEPSTDCSTHYETHTHTETYTEDHIHGYWHRFSPDIAWKKVGEYKVATGYSHSEGLDPVLGGFVGVMGGMAVGAGIGFVVNVAANALFSKLDGDEPYDAPASYSYGKKKQRQDSETPSGGGIVNALKKVYSNNEDFLKATATIGGVVGAGVGGYVGYQAAVQQQTHNQSVTQTWQEPDLARKYLGDVPDTHYSYFPSMDTRPLGEKYERYPDGTLRLPGSDKDPVYRDVPQYGEDGSIKMKEVSKTFNSAKFGPIAGTIAGIGIGAGVGIGLGIATGLAIKMIDQTVEMVQEEKKAA
ncbi:MAG: hypothetical protein HYU64_18550 [Armatimonadetes bacterium]|nr:hypothetical protein [Armatimonadota bacterium]